MDSGRSYRTILRASMIMGMSSGFNILFGIIKIKVAAVLLGPAGVGLIGLLQNILVTASTIFSVGLDTAGTRAIANENAQKGQVELLQSALFLGSLLTGITGTVLFYIFFDTLVSLFAVDVEDQRLVWLALGITMAAVSMSQVAVLNGLREIKSLALLKVGASAAASIIGIGAIFLFGSAGIIIFVLCVPFSMMVFGLLLVRRLGLPTYRKFQMKVIFDKWRELFPLGCKFMLGAVVAIVGPLAVRVIVQKELGTTALGYFEAAWIISMTYMGFVLGAMATDYFPRLSAIVNQPSDARMLVNQQTEVALYLVAPMLVLMMALSPWIIILMYSQEFEPSAQLLRLQIFGDFLKILSWPLGFIILASGRGLLFVFTEASGMFVFAIITWLMLPVFGINGSGIGFIALYLIYLPLVYFISRKLIDFSWTRKNVHHFIRLLVCLLAVFGVSFYADIYAALLGLLIAVFLVVDAVLFFKSTISVAKG